MKKIKQLVCLSVLLIQILCTPMELAYAYTDYTEEISYVYNRYGGSVKIPTAYEYKTYISLKEVAGLDITSPADMFVKENGELFVIDSKLGAILMFSKELKFTGSLAEFRMPDGTATVLNKPEGIFVTKEDLIYVADTGNNRILVCDRQGNVNREILQPETILGTDLVSFLPTRVVVDSAGRISVVSRNINSGIMQFSAEGVFTGYVGAPSVKIDAFSKLLRKFSTAKQRAQMQTYVPTEYNNIKIDSKNFIWGTISSLSGTDIASVINNKDLSGSVTPIKKLNTMGADVLRRKGVFAPVGELWFYDTPSKIIDVGIGPNGIYSMLDSQVGRIFTYNNDGILLYAFAQKGTKKGNTQNPVAIDYIGNQIVVLDSGLCQLIVYEPTDYGTLLIDAEGYYAKGDYEMSNELWKQVAELNSNFEYAYIGLGNSNYSNKEYEEAMEYYKYADDSDAYSKAKEMLRKDSAKQVFPIVFLVIILSILLYLGGNIVRRIRRYARGEDMYVRKEEED